MKPLLYGLSAILLSSQVWAAQELKRQWVTPDFFVQTEAVGSQEPSSNSATLDNGSDCRAGIRAKMCLVDPAKSERDIDDNVRPCLAGGETYAVYFEEVYDQFPQALQKMFCSLKKIYIEKKFDGTAYGGLFTDKNHKVTGGALMGIRQSVLDKNLRLQRWATWKEQLSFGAANDTNYVLVDGLPSITTETAETLNDFLYFVVAHEFGHMFDFANGLNTSETWTALSWEKTGKGKGAKYVPIHNFQNHEGLCFYWCENHPLHKTDVSGLYSEWANTNFISLYATTQQWDDWADSVAYFMVHENLHTKYVIDTNQGAQYDIMNRVGSAAFSKKYDYIKAFFSRNDIVYP